ncbi:DUF1835 domain-containing protein [Methylobacterium sp. J-026]|uniref:DUF3658 domain-containing protein n=1 Tax=Methylobacterium sp. J-026 TaxID=2836624 RepID=UPI001FBA5F87|nr:DUF3658 domain-containing protein [Methylobacterium sp. J-026]MCJ2135308.1 DUF1835 domain-containing protein [Methylobacterium sp. J-026]
MTEGARIVHVVFGRSVAATLRDTLASLGIPEPVIGLPDSLSVGPIDPADADTRQAWDRSVLRSGSALRDERDDDPIDAEQAWAAATAPGTAPVFWACLRAPAEHACFLAFAARMHGRPFDFVDATDLDITTADGIRSPWSLGMLRRQDIVASNLYARRRPLSPDARRAASDAWSRLQRENAPFRIVRDGRLVSAPLTHYDALLVGQAGPDWEIAARLIGRAMATFWDAPSGDGTGDAVLFGRMLALGEAGALEIAGPGPGLRAYQVRRPAG